jgi:hypothetical protein
MAIIRQRIIIIPEDIDPEDEEILLTLINLANVGIGTGFVWRDTIAQIAYVRSLRAAAETPLSISTVGDEIVIDLDTSGFGDFSTNVSTVATNALVSFNGTDGKEGTEAPFSWELIDAGASDKQWILKIYHDIIGTIKAVGTWRHDFGNGNGTQNYLIFGDDSARTLIRCNDFVNGPWVGLAESAVLHQQRSAGWKMDNAGYLADIHFFDDRKISGLETVTFNGEYDNGLSGTAKTIDWDNGQKQNLVMNNNCTLTFADPGEGGAGNFILKLEYASTTPRTITWPSTVLWRFGAPTLSGDANKADVITFYWNGSKYFATAAIGFVLPA